MYNTSFGTNLRVTGHCGKGDRKYMEDMYSVSYEYTDDRKDLEYVFFGIYDGHGGDEAATYAKERLLDSITRQDNFWSDNDKDVLDAITDGFRVTQYCMWRDKDFWPKTDTSSLNYAGTTASVAFIRRGKIFIGNVGDSTIVLGYQEPGSSDWKARPLTNDHNPENKKEKERIELCGGRVITKGRVARVIQRTKRRDIRRIQVTVARSLGDLWSYNSDKGDFIISPQPDTYCIPIDTKTFRCLILATKGLWFILNPNEAVKIIQSVEEHNDSYAKQTAIGATTDFWMNPSKCLVNVALKWWFQIHLFAVNTSAVTVMFDSFGPPKSEIIQNQIKSPEIVALNELEMVEELQYQVDSRTPSTSTIFSENNESRLNLRSSTDSLIFSLDNSESPDDLSPVTSNDTENYSSDNLETTNESSSEISTNTTVSSKESNKPQKCSSKSLRTQSLKLKKSNKRELLKKLRCNSESPKRTIWPGSKKNTKETFKPAVTKKEQNKQTILKPKISTGKAILRPKIKSRSFNDISEPPRKLRRVQSLGHLNYNNSEVDKNRNTKNTSSFKRNNDSKSKQGEESL